jgi:hypothetical protein
MKQTQQQPQSGTASRTMIRYILTEKGTTESGRAFERYKAVYADPSLSLQSLASSPEAQQQRQQQQQQPLVAVTVKEWAQSLAYNAAVTAPELTSVLRDAPFAAFFWETKGVSADTAADTAFEFVLVDAPQLAVLTGNKAAFANQLNSRQCAAQSVACRFYNLSGDAVLVAPKPLVSLPVATTKLSLLASGRAADTNHNNNRISSNNAQQQLLLPYAHLANFVRQAPAHQVTGLWQMAASAYLEALLLDNNDNEEDSMSSAGRRNNNKLTSNLKNRKTSSGTAKPVWFSTSGMGVAWLHFRLDERPKYYTFRAFAEENVKWLYIIITLTTITIITDNNNNRQRYSSGSFFSPSLYSNVDYGYCTLKLFLWSL